MEVQDKDVTRLQRSLRLALDQGEGMTAVLDKDGKKMRYFSRRLMCPTTGISYSDAAPHDFSFNSPKGCCKRCHGTGYISQIDIEKLIPIVLYLFMMEVLLLLVDIKQHNICTDRSTL